MFSLESYDAIRTRAAVVRRTDRAVLKVTGADRSTWLQGLLTNDVLAIPVQPDSVRTRAYGAWLTPQGRMVTDVWVVPGVHDLLLDLPASIASSLKDRLQGLVFAEDVHVADVSAETGVIETYGPHVNVSDAPDDNPDAADLPDSDATPPLVGAVDRTLGVPAVVSYLPAEILDEFIERSRESGAAEADLDTLDVVRIEAGVPKFLVDMDEHTIPLEAGIEDRAISFTKGCYVGQEVIVRVTTRGQGRVAKRLVGLIVGQVGLAKLLGRIGVVSTLAGATVASGERNIGRITSAAVSPSLDRVIALAYLHRDFVEPGTVVQVGDQAAVVTALPFVPPIAGDANPS